MEKVKTGIAGLDNILGGGIPKGHCILLAGSCGTGKTILCEQFLFYGAKKFNENGVYISLGEPKETLTSNMEAFNFFDAKLIDSGMIKIVDMNQDTRLKGIGMQNTPGLINIIREIIQDNKAKRVVIDSITALGQGINDEKKIRDFVFELGFQLRYMGGTTILTSEIPPQKFVYSVFGVEEFISDGVILITEFERKGDLIRALQVIKMRGVNHSRNKHVLKIIEDGINLVPMFKAESE